MKLYNGSGIAITIFIRLYSKHRRKLEIFWPNRKSHRRYNAIIIYYKWT